MKFNRGPQGIQGQDGTQGEKGAKGDRGVKLQGWERLGFMFLLIIMVVSTTSTAIASQQAAKAAKNTDLIAQCTTPGTKCFDLQRVQEAKRTSENKCVIDSLINLPPITERVARRAEILAQYDKCVLDETKVNVSTTTTTLVSGG